MECPLFEKILNPCYPSMLLKNIDLNWPCGSCITIVSPGKEYGKGECILPSWTKCGKATVIVQEK